MMKKKNNVISVNNESINNFGNNNFYKQNNFNSNSYTFNLPPSSKRNELSNEGKKILNQKEINDWQKKKIKINISSNKKKNVNSNLLSTNYVKPLKFALKNRIEAINTQFDCYRNDSRILNQKKCLQSIVNNNSFKYNFNSFKSNDKKEKFSQYSSANSLVKNDTSKQIGKTSSVRAPKNKSKSKSKSKKNNNKKTKNSSDYNTDKKDKDKNKN